MTIASFLIGVLTCSINVWKLRREGVKKGNLGRVVLSTLIFGYLEAIFLILVACFDDRRFPVVHDTSAGLFFSFGAVFCYLNVGIYTYLWRKNREDKKLKISAIIKIVVSAFYTIFFIIFVPIGLPISCSKLNSTTHEYNYTPCYGANVMSVVTEYGSVLCLLIFNAVFYLDFSNHLNEEDFTFSLE